MTAIPPLLQEIHTRLAGRAGDIKRDFTQPLTLHYSDEIPTDKGQYDLVISHLGATFAENPPAYFLEVGRCLQPDGLLLASVLGAESFMELRQLENAPNFTPLPDVRDVGTVLQNYKFALPVIDKDILTLTFSTPEKMTETLEQCGFAPLLCGIEWLKKTDFGTLKRFDGLYALTLEVIYAHGWFPAANQPQPLQPGSATVSLSEVLS